VTRKRVPRDRRRRMARVITAFVRGRWQARTADLFLVREALSRLS
jgi:hypothetical protein